MGVYAENSTVKINDFPTLITLKIVTLLINLEVQVSQTVNGTENGLDGPNLKFGRDG